MSLADQLPLRDGSELELGTRTGDDDFEFDAFLSYVHVDAAVVTGLAAQLREAGVRVWLDQWCIKPAEDIVYAVEEGLSRSRVHVLCLSRAALESGWFRLELSVSMTRDPSNRGGRVVPVLLEELELPMILQRIKHIDWREPNRSALDVIIEACGIGTGASEELNDPDPMVSRAQFRAFTSGRPRFGASRWDLDGHDVAGDDDDLPMTNVSWDEALAYCDWMGGRMPSHSGRSVRTDSTGKVEELLEWLDSGSRDHKRVQEVRTRRIVGTLERGDRHRQLGFRCLPVGSPASLRWVRLEGGSFRLGANERELEYLAVAGVRPDALRPIISRGARRVRVPTFCISSECVTNRQYHEFTRVTGYSWPRSWHAKWIAISKFPFPARLFEYPVVDIDYHDAREYCRWARVRLPRWFEWERAASGAEGHRFPWGDEYEAERCNGLDIGCGLRPVNEFPRGDSPQGVRQLCGNVLEWVSGDGGQNELRGGSHRLRCEIWGNTRVFRVSEPGYVATDVGFRVVRDG